MIHAYSKRLLSPYLGQVQIIETSRARALTLDGKMWEIQFIRSSADNDQNHDSSTPNNSYIRVASIEDSEIKRLTLPSFLEEQGIDDRILELSEFIKGVELPLPAADHYEYWLLDYKDESPLALIYSCVKAEEMPMYPSRPEWTALSAARMEVKKTPDEQAYYVPPVNYRLEQLVTERAGKRPRAAWIKRRASETQDFPPCLVSELWEEEEHHQLCQRYIQRQAPRLLMLHQLEHADRLRLEIAAKENALEVERFYPLYPEVVDEQQMSAIRVEARMRRGVQPN